MLVVVKKQLRPLCKVMVYLTLQTAGNCPVVFYFVTFCLFRSPNSSCSSTCQDSRPAHLTPQCEGNWVIHPQPPYPTSDDPSPWYSLISLSCSGMLTPLIEMGMSIKEPKNLLPGPHFKGTVGRGLWVCTGICTHSVVCAVSVWQVSFSNTSKQFASRLTLRRTSFLIVTEKHNKLYTLAKTN